MAEKIKVDLSEVDQLGRLIREGSEIGLRRVLERGEQIFREEVPKETHNLEQGVSSDVAIPKTGLLTGRITVSARAGRRGSRSATLHLSSGKIESISLSPQPSFDYAETVARGRVSIDAGQGKALLIPVSAVPTLNGKPAPYIEDGKQKYIMRRHADAVAPNPFDERAMKRIEPEGERIIERALDETIKG